jgi:SAM-dependent methyltransferase
MLSTGCSAAHLIDRRHALSSCAAVTDRSLPLPLLYLLLLLFVLCAQGDACALPAGLGTFDAVLAANLLCRVPDPQACLAGIADALNPGGVLVLTR